MENDRKNDYNVHKCNKIQLKNKNHQKYNLKRRQSRPKQQKCQNKNPKKASTKCCAKL